MLAIVEDDASARAALISLVGALGFSAHGFPDAASLLTFPRLGRVRCLICDMRLPGINGLQLYHQLRDAGHSLPVILITGYPDPATARAALRAGAVAYLAKPVPPERLLACLRAVLQR
ncbi:response regulator transcription factor [Teichococcus vastitatis]|uniref:Response regulator n=1 Tax=Teichococcus vastitatis TaxID=2307076 RepID=A0ABS9W2D6_9PROT|nr:response regulator [Pseudoroseomonas vastitatis]MCI0753455.1 response regulator [Pseudoroseomonas vastitatis]